MQVEVRLDPTYTDPKVILLTDKMTKELEELVKKLTDTPLRMLAGFRNGVLEVLPPEEVIRFFSEKQRIYAQTAQGIYSLRARLYELEEMLDTAYFIRISHSEIINLRKVLRMDLSLAGTILVTLESDIETYASRRYVPKIKKALGL